MLDFAKLAENYNRQVEREAARKERFMDALRKRNYIIDGWDVRYIYIDLPTTVEAVDPEDGAVEFKTPERLCGKRAIQLTDEKMMEYAKALRQREKFRADVDGVNHVAAPWIEFRFLNREDENDVDIVWKLYVVNGKEEHDKCLKWTGEPGPFRAI